MMIFPAKRAHDVFLAKCADDDFFPAKCADDDLNVLEMQYSCISKAEICIRFVYVW